MGFQSSDLGEIGNLAKAIGLVKERQLPGRLAHQAGHLSADVLSNASQREALIAFLDGVLGGSERRTDSAGRIWLPIIEGADPDISFFVVLDESPEQLHLYRTRCQYLDQQSASETSLFVPLFKAGKGNRASPIPSCLAATVPSSSRSRSRSIRRRRAGRAHLGRVGSAGGSDRRRRADFLADPGCLAAAGCARTARSGDLARFPRYAGRYTLDLVLGLIQAQAAGLLPDRLARSPDCSG